MSVARATGVPTAQPRRRAGKDHRAVIGAKATRVLPGHFNYVGDLDRYFVPRHGLQFQSPSMSVNGLSVLSARLQPAW